MNRNSYMEIANLNKNIDFNQKSNFCYKYIIIFLLIFIIIFQISDKFLFKNDFDIKIQKANQLLKTLKAEKNTLLNLENNYNIYNKIKLLKLYTNNNELRYKNFEICLLNDPDSQKCIYHLILPKNVVGKKRILLGEKGDGCYVLLDDLKDKKNCLQFRNRKKNSI